MNDTAKVIRPHIPPGRRVLAISDIHGNLSFFRGVLEKARFSPADVLILVGDLFEKGEESLNLLRALLELSQTHTVYPLCGNCDHLDLIFLEGRPGIDQALWPVFRTWDRRSLLLQMPAYVIGCKPPALPPRPGYGSATQRYSTRSWDARRL